MKPSALAWMAALLGPLVLLAPTGARAGARADEMDTLARKLEADRVAIEADRKKLNADCPRVAERDAPKLGDCRARYEDVLRRMEQYRRELARLKALREGPATCRELAEKLARWELGAKHAAEGIRQNDRFIQDAQKDSDKAFADGADLAKEKVFDAFTDHLAAFLKKRENLKRIKKGFDELEKLEGTRKHAYPPGSRQRKRLAKWIDDGVEMGKEAFDLGEKIQEAMDTPGGTKNLDPSLLGRFQDAVGRFTGSFTSDEEAWELAGETLSEAVGGPGGKAAFQSAVFGIKASTAALGAAIAQRDLNTFHRNQAAMGDELKELQQKIRDTRSEMAMHRCP